MRAVCFRSGHVRVDKRVRVERSDLSADRARAAGSTAKQPPREWADGDFPPVAEIGKMGSGAVMPVCEQGWPSDSRRRRPLCFRFRCSMRIWAGRQGEFMGSLVPSSPRLRTDRKIPVVFVEDTVSRYGVGVFRAFPSRRRRPGYGSYPVAGFWCW